MTQPIHLRDIFWAQKVPEMAMQFKIDMGYLIYKVPNYDTWVTDEILMNYSKLRKHLKKHENEPDFKTGGTPLPPGTWQILCSSTECTPEQAHEIVEREGDGFKDYDKDNFHYDLPFMNVIDSFNSLLKGKGCDPDKSNYVILKRIS